jgi:hypothetical protein
LTHDSDLSGFGGRRRAAESLAASGLFIGQSPECFAALTPLAQAADAASARQS